MVLDVHTLAGLAVGLQSIARSARTAETARCVDARLAAPTVRVLTFVIVCKGGKLFPSILGTCAVTRANRNYPVSFQYSSSSANFQAGTQHDIG